jgi:energy-coupling factor transport system permease protein
MFTPLAAPRGPLATLNPLVGLVVVAIAGMVTIISFDPVAVSIMLIAELPLLVLARLPGRGWLVRAWPLATGLAGIMIANLLFTDDHSGRTMLEVGPLLITTGGLAGAGVVAMRLLVLAIPGIVLFSGLDPTELSDALITHWHARPRVAIGSLAALRMAPLVLSDLGQSYAARRTRGVLSRNPLRVFRMIYRTLVGVLVTTIRRATRLSVAMDSRGFDSGLPRTLARVSVWRLRDTLVIIGYSLAGAVAVTMTVLARLS